MTDVPIIYFANNGATLIELSKQSGADVLGLDWRIKLDDAARLAGNHVLQGNLDPIALFLPKDALEQRIATILSEGKAAKGHIFNLGHGILPQTPPEQVKIAVEAVHRLSSR
jgi:uroporphyrinogen decarboxylase